MENQPKEWNSKGTDFDVEIGKNFDHFYENEICD